MSSEGLGARSGYGALDKREGVCLCPSDCWSLDIAEKECTRRRSPLRQLEDIEGPDMEHSLAELNEYLIIGDEDTREERISKE